jgi:exosortase
LIALAGAATAALLPFLVRHASWLWVRPHYQFFPLVLVGAAVLAYRGLRGVELRRGDPRTAGIGLAAAWLILLAAVVLDSSWLGCVAAMVLVPALAYATGGKDLVHRLLPAWGLLWLLVPPPLDLDRVLIYQLQGWTTGWSSEVLDALGVFHVRAGNSIEIGGRSLFVEQACSGINSLFSVLACTLFFVLAGRRGWVRGVILMVSAVGWVLVANVARVVLVVLLETRWGVSAATGWRHEVLGLTLFAIAVGLVLSTDRLIDFLAGPVPAPPADGPSPPVAARGVAGRAVALAAVPAFLLLLVAHLALAGVGRAEPGTAPAPLASNADLLPPRIGPWERTDFAVLSRESDSYFGEYSHTWRYTRNGISALVSLDSPFPAWHDLTWCYVGTGWRIDEQEVKEAAAVPGGFVEVRLNRPVNRHGYLVFAEFDRRGRPLTARPGGTAASPFRHRAALARFGLGGEAPAADPAPPVYQLQVFVEGSAPLGSGDEADVRELFSRARHAIGDAWAAGR